MPGYSISEASEILKVSKEAVRKRISRGTLRADKNPDNTWTIFIDDTSLQDDVQGTDGTNILLAKIDMARATIEGLQRELALSTKLADVQKEHDAQEIEKLQQTNAALVLQLERLEKSLEKERDARTSEAQRNDTLIAQLTQRLPQLPEKASESRSWWRFWK